MVTIQLLSLIISQTFFLLLLQVQISLGMASGADGKQWVEVRGKRSDRCDAKVNSYVHVNFSIWSKSLLLSANLLSYQTCKIFMYTCCFYFLLFYECIDRITSRRCAILRSALRSTCLMSCCVLCATTTSSLRVSTTPSSSSTLTVSSDTVFIVCYICFNWCLRCVYRDRPRCVISCLCD